LLQLGGEEGKNIDFYGKIDVFPSSPPMDDLRNVNKLAFSLSRSD
jgi:hypothetical protein